MKLIKEYFNRNKEANAEVLNEFYGSLYQGVSEEDDDLLIFYRSVERAIKVLFEKGKINALNLPEMKYNEVSSQFLVEILHVNDTVKSTVKFYMAKTKEPLKVSPEPFLGIWSDGSKLFVDVLASGHEGEGVDYIHTKEVIKEMEKFYREDVVICDDVEETDDVTSQCFSIKEIAYDPSSATFGIGLAPLK